LEPYADCSPESGDFFFIFQCFCFLTLLLFDGFHGNMEMGLSRFKKGLICSSIALLVSGIDNYFESLGTSLSLSLSEPLDMHDNNKKR
jgi:hypothetical protein